MQNSQSSSQPLAERTFGIADLAVAAQSNRGLSVLSDAYTTLYHLQTESHASAGDCGDGTCMDVTEPERENHASAVGDIMLHIAWQVVEAPSQTWLDARAKAVVLLDWVGHDKSDVTDQLAASLSRDIIALFDALEPKRCDCPKHVATRDRNLDRMVNSVTSGQTQKAAQPEPRRVPGSGCDDR
jgi:hypothetical protein